MVPQQSGQLLFAVTRIVYGLCTTLCTSYLISLLLIMADVRLSSADKLFLNMCVQHIYHQSSRLCMIQASEFKMKLVMSLMKCYVQVF